MRSLVSRCGHEERRPTLILAGDLLELALASDEYSAIVFQQFMEVVMAPGEEIFDQIWFLPGNHDHHLWEAAREAQYASFLEEYEGQEIPHPRFMTRMFYDHQEHAAISPLLTALLRRARRAAASASLASSAVSAALTASPSANSAAAKPDESSIPVIYPNLAVRKDDRFVLFSHGHYIESAYQLLTNLNTILFGAPAPPSISALEEGNFAWIDFFWSVLGRAGDPGERVQYVYDRLRSPENRKDLIHAVSTNLALLIKNRTRFDSLEDRMQHQVVEMILTQIANWGSTIGRQTYYGGKGPAEAHNQGLEEYLSAYVLPQLADECAIFAEKDARETPAETTFVFGHTHHPFVRSAQPVKGHNTPVAVFNTGGWIHETKELQQQIGASLVVVDEDLNVAAIELYREVSSLASDYPRVAEASDADEPHEHSALWHSLKGALSQDADVWRDLTSRIATRLTASGE